MKTNKIKIIEISTGKTFPNLRGVFQRVFPIACNSVKYSGNVEYVTYYNDAFKIIKNGSEQL